TKVPARRSGMASATEWRTAPLWGVADSAPYLHDGRASTLDEAVRRHGGEAQQTSTRYTLLAASDRKALLSFLGSLTVSPNGNRSRAHPRNSPSTRQSELKSPIAPEEGG